jgi:hypothetical protein
MTSFTYTDGIAGGTATMDSSRLVVELETGKVYVKGGNYGSGPIPISPLGSAGQTARSPTMKWVYKSFKGGSPFRHLAVACCINR